MTAGRIVAEAHTDAGLPGDHAGDGEEAVARVRQGIQGAVVGDPDGRRASSG